MPTEEKVFPRNFMARCVYAWLFVIMVFFFYNHSLLSQLESPVVTSVTSDNTYWLLHLLNIPQFFFNNYWAALLFDVVLTTSCLIFIFVPEKTIFAWVTVIGCWILYISYCSAAGHHFAQIGFLLAPMAFLVKKQFKFDLLWKLIRYWVCFLYVCAGLYKIYYGGVFQADNMAEILRFMNADWLFFSAGTTVANTVYFLIEHEELSQWMYRIATVVDLAMLIGFFTYRFDRWLLAGLLIFHIGNYFLLHISFVEQSLIFAPFLPWHRIAGRITNNYYND